MSPRGGRRGNAGYRASTSHVSNRASASQKWYCFLTHQTQRLSHIKRSRSVAHRVKLGTARHGRQLSGGQEVQEASAGRRVCRAAGRAVSKGVSKMPLPRSEGAADMGAALGNRTPDLRITRSPGLRSMLATCTHSSAPDPNAPSAQCARGSRSTIRSTSGHLPSNRLLLRGRTAPSRRQPACANACRGSDAERQPLGQTPADRGAAPLRSGGPRRTGRRAPCNGGAWDRLSAASPRFRRSGKTL